MAELLERVSERPVSEDAAPSLRERTDGNPFFLVEFARLAGERGRLDAAVRVDAHRGVGGAHPAADPAARRDRRARCATAAVIGRQFDTPTLAAATGIDEDDLLDVVEPAQAAGLVREDGIDRFLFSHALVRDTLRSGDERQPAGPRPRPGRGRARGAGWPRDRGGPALAGGGAVVRRAGLAGRRRRGRGGPRLHAYDEAVELLRAALGRSRQDPGATARDRYDVLMALIEAYRWSALLPDLVRCVEQAIEVGKELRDSEAVARAAIATTEGALWRSAPPGQVNDLWSTRCGAAWTGCRPATASCGAA